MGIGTSVFLFVLGAILAFAVHVPVDGINVQALGFILMVVGLVGGALSLLFWSSWGGWGGWGGWGEPRTPVYRRRSIVDSELGAAPMVVREVPARPVVVAAPQPVVGAAPVVPAGSLGGAVPGEAIPGEVVPVVPVVGQGVPVVGAAVPVAGPPVRVRRTTVYEDRL